jgi:hypothetical protein
MNCDCRLCRQHRLDSLGEARCEDGVMAPAFEIAEILIGAGIMIALSRREFMRVLHHGPPFTLRPAFTNLISLLDKSPYRKSKTVADPMSCINLRWC